MEIVAQKRQQPPNKALHPTAYSSARSFVPHFVAALPAAGELSRSAGARSVDEIAVSSNTWKLLISMALVVGAVKVFKKDTPYMRSNAKYPLHWI